MNKALAELPVGTRFTVPADNGYAAHLADAGELEVAGPVGSDLRIPLTDGRRLPGFVRVTPKG